MQYIGEILSLVVAVAWTGAALFSEAATLRIGTIVLNVIRMAGSLLVLGVILWVVTGFPLPQYLNAEAWLWLSLSGLVGYVFGDYCLFNSYLTIGSRYGQLFMTLAPLAAALAGWLILGEKMSLMGILGMLVVGTGIGMSVLNKGGGGQHRPHLKLPVRGVLYGIGAAVGQGVGLVLSKLGMEHYQDGIAAHFGGDLTQAGAVLDYVPMASTFVRAITGLIGFFIIMVLSGKARRLAPALRDKKGMLFTFCAILCGPTIGVSLSLLATLYTNAGVAQTLMSLTPVLIIWPTWLIYRQKVTVLEVVGACVAVAGASLFFL